MNLEKISNNLKKLGFEGNYSERGLNMEWRNRQFATGKIHISIHKIYGSNTFTTEIGWSSGGGNPIQIRRFAEKLRQVSRLKM